MKLPPRPFGLPIRPDLWAGFAPNGIGQQKPNHYREVAEAMLANLRHPLYALQLLRKGVCDGCALGVAGIHDWTIDGIHLCTTRLRLLELNTADPLDTALLADAEVLRSRSGAELRSLGRLAHPMRRRRGQRGFRRIGWDEALDTLAAAIAAARPERCAVYLTGRGLTNETYYVAAKAARALGIASIDSAARVCHAPSGVGLVDTLGVSAATCSLRDVVESELVVLWGTNPANNQPMFMKHLYEARRRGARVVVINPYLEPGLERYWVPSSPESALFGTRFCDLHIPVRPGGDVALANAVLKLLIDAGAVEERFVAEHTEGWEDLVECLASQDLDELCARAGLDPSHAEAFAQEYARAGSAVLIWAMGITQHGNAVDGVRAIVNLALARGNIGRRGAGLIPLRGHSGVQGGAEMGAYATALPGGVEVNESNASQLAARWGFQVPSSPGLTMPEAIDAAGRGELEVLWCSGGNLLDVLPDPPRIEEALARVPLRVHQDVIVSSQMLVPGDDVILLPVATRYEQEGGGTETTTERRVVYSPEIPRRVGEARSEWRLFADVATRVRPELRRRFSWADARALRSEIAEVIPSYAGVEALSEPGDSIQRGGRHLCGGGCFPTSSGRGRFSTLVPAGGELAEGELWLSTRRGKQFNSMIFEEVDPLTGAGRDAVLMNEADALAAGVGTGDRVLLRSKVGEMEATVLVAPLARGSVQVHWPEGNVLIGHTPDGREPISRVPDYNAVVTVHPR